ncbi:28S ribosomal protein S10, mitochondrial-like [Asterias rubens]|uniref:28S ribosomal protein S10, mitochondrial-like n=1 Tax=Asterias rubens TaxID=7604 RepID=UPI0014556350|nr:28S ribosomal protein S10, mitochondrial-like [Asterias rubens]
MWKSILTKSATFLRRVESVQAYKNNSLLTKLCLFSKCSHTQRSFTVCQRFYCSQTTGFKSIHSFLPSGYCHTSVRDFSCSTTQNKSQQITTNEVEDTEELDQLYKTVELKVKGHDDSLLDSYELFVTMAAKELGIQVESVTKPLKRIQRLTLLKSRHIFKKHRVQYEMRTHFRVITLMHLTGTTADVFLEYVERNLPEGVAMKVTKCALEKLPEHLQTPPEASIDSSSSTSASSSSSSEDEDESLRQVKE